MPTVTVDRRELARLLRTIRGVNGSLRAAGTWTLRPGELQIDWGNGGGILEARVTAGVDAEPDQTGTEQTCHVDPALMVRLPLVLSGKGDVTVSMDEGHLLLDRLAMTAFLERNPQDPLLPKSPRPVDYLLLPARHDAEVIEAAGLTPHVAKAQVRHAETLAAVAKRLEWLGISPDEVKKFVSERLKARAKGQEPLPL
jgi:hypothetical protein